MSREQHFKPELFRLDEKAEQWQLDQEVAARIADTLYFGDKEVQSGNNYSDPNVIVDPTGQTLTRTLRYGEDRDSDESWSYRISFDANAADSVNGAFASEVKTALFEGERRNRLGLKGSLAFASFGAAVPTGLTIAALETNLPGVVQGEMIGTGAVIGGLILKSVPHHLYRLYAAKPGTFANRRQLNAAARLIDTMKLPPVVIK
jgi:hypothetical protein